jgi:hypothetical protein
MNNIVCSGPGSVKNAMGQRRKITKRVASRAYRLCTYTSQTMSHFKRYPALHSHILKFVQKTKLNAFRAAELKAQEQAAVRVILLICQIHVCHRMAVIYRYS